jgi:apolipoprotein D and lipocalin family protein
MNSRFLILALLAAGCATSTERLGLGPLSTVAKVELPKYLGTWYEIASFPQRFQKGCTGSTATYSLRPDGTIDVLNKCRLESLQGPEKIAHGRARVVDAQTQARLEVSFFRPFWGDYWVVDLAPDYTFAVVGHPSRDYLWILSRTPQMPPEVYDAILARLRASGYDLDRLSLTPQPVTDEKQAGR